VLLVSVLALSTTAEAAKSAGTSQPHAETIDGVPLAPMTSAQLTVCKKFANDIKAPVVCPELLPVPIVRGQFEVPAGGQISPHPSG
jgi:hypothetical protein